MSNRKLLVKSAQYWFDGARENHRNGKSTEAVMGMENALNHTENALAASMEVLRRLVNTEGVSDLKLHSTIEKAKEVLAQF